MLTFDTHRLGGKTHREPTGEAPLAALTGSSGPPPCVVEALRNFVELIEAYGETGVWPDNYTLRKLATEGREALNCGHTSKQNEKAET